MKINSKRIGYNIALHVTIFLLIGTTGCALKTRSEVAEAQERKQLQTQVNQFQKIRAEEESKRQELEEELRKLNGRIETVEHRYKLSDDKQKNESELTKRSSQEILAQMKDFDERLGKLEKRLGALEAGLAAAAEADRAERSERAEKVAESGKAGEGKDSKKKESPDWDSGSELFDKKQWKKAIVAYNSYRDKNPKGGHVAEATYRIGVCFQELGMKAEAKAFFEEAVEKFPKSKVASKAQYRLKNLK